jgi:hypothetical protein
MNQIRNRALIGALVVIVASALVIACGDDSDDDPEAVTTIATMVSEGEQTPAVEPAGPTAEPSPPDLTTDAPPDTTASSGETTVEMGIGTYCWTNLCVDKIGPITRDLLTIVTGDEVIIEIPSGTPPLREVSVIAFRAAEPQELDNGETAWRPDYDNGETLASERDEEEIRIEGTLEPGMWVLTVGMFFEPGDVQYGVVLEVR